MKADHFGRFHVGAVDAEGSGGLKMQFEMFDKLLWIT